MCHAVHEVTQCLGIISLASTIPHPQTTIHDHAHVCPTQAEWRFCFALSSRSARRWGIFPRPTRPRWRRPRAPLPRSFAAPLLLASWDSKALPKPETSHMASSGLGKLRFQSPSARFVCPGFGLDCGSRTGSPLISSHPPLRCSQSARPPRSADSTLRRFMVVTFVACAHASRSCLPCGRCGRLWRSSES